MVSAHAEAWLKVIERLIEQSGELAGNPDTFEIVDRVQKVVRKLRAMAAIEPLTKHEYHFLAAAFLTEEFFPDRMPALEKALEPGLDAVDEAIVSMDATNRNIDTGFMREISRKAQEIAARRVFLKAQEEARARLAKKAGQVAAT